LRENLDRAVRSIVASPLAWKTVTAIVAVAFGPAIPIAPAAAAGPEAATVAPTPSDPLAPAALAPAVRGATRGMCTPAGAVLVLDALAKAVAMCWDPQPEDRAPATALLVRNYAVAASILAQVGSAPLRTAPAVFAALRSHLLQQQQALRQTQQPAVTAADGGGASASAYDSIQAAIQSIGSSAPGGALLTASRESGDVDEDGEDDEARMDRDIFLALRARMQRDATAAATAAAALSGPGAALGAAAAATAFAPASPSIRRGPSSVASPAASSSAAGLGTPAAVRKAPRVRHAANSSDPRVVIRSVLTGPLDEALPKPPPGSVLGSPGALTPAPAPAAPSIFSTVLLGLVSCLLSSNHVSALMGLVAPSGVTTASADASAEGDCPLEVYAFLAQLSRVLRISPDRDPIVSLAATEMVRVANPAASPAGPSPLQRLWQSMWEDKRIRAFQGLEACVAIHRESKVATALVFFLNVLGRALLEADDEDFFTQGFPIDVTTVVGTLLPFLRTLLFRVFWADSMCLRLPLSRRPVLVLQVAAASVRVFNLLFDRHARRLFPEWTADHWLWPALPAADLSADVILGIAEDRVEDEAMDETSSGSIAASAAAASLAAGGGPGNGQSDGYDMSDDEDVESAPQQSLHGVVYAGMKGVRQSRSQLVLTQIPQVVAFNTRVALFQALRSRDKAIFMSTVNPPMHMFDFFDGDRDRVKFTVHRANLVQDAYSAFLDIASERRSLKSHFKIEFINKEGLPEAGIDGGGLLKEFVDSLVKQAFSPEYGLFKETSQHALYPNPATRFTANRSALGGPHLGDLLSYYEFLGKILGKALYEGILVEPKFAGFFLRKLLGKSNTFDDIWTLDPELHRGLSKMKYYSATEINDLAMSFELTEDMPLGGVATVTLLDDGRGGAVTVTAANVHQYVALLANHKLNVQIAPQCRAFLRGFRTLVPLSWMRMFKPPELQSLLGGDDSRVDLADLRANIVYSHGLHDRHPYVQGFWEVLHSLSQEDLRSFLMFVTSCSRPPLLGFGALNPKFAIAGVPIAHDSDKLPSASTCFNQLKLPIYSSIEVLREKLLLSIRSKAGFELT
jgi:ubiquitin-protein ligase E3 C